MEITDTRESRNRAIGIIGCGRAAVALHMPALQKIPQAHVAALADTDSSVLAAAADRFGIANRASDVKGLLSFSDIDVLAVCVPATEHVSAALPIIEDGRHLLIEKPLALDRAGCEQLLTAAATSASRITVGFNLRHHRLIRAASELIVSGQLGQIEAIHSTWTSAIRRRQSVPQWRNQRETGGGALFEIAVHHFDLWRYLLRTEIEEVQARSRGNEWPDETVLVTARLANGVLASGTFSERSSDRNTLEVIGREGRLSVDLFRYDGFGFVSADVYPGAAHRLREALAGLATIPKGLKLLRQGGDFLLSYQNQWRAFLASIDGSPYYGATLADGMAATSAVLAAIEAAESGRSVSP